MNKLVELACCLSVVSCLAFRCLVCRQPKSQACNTLVVTVLGQPRQIDGRRRKVKVVIPIMGAVICEYFLRDGRVFFWIFVISG
jgi:hypothetical protein